MEERGYQKKAEERFARADKLTKLENNLLDVIDDLEDKPQGEIVAPEIIKEEPQMPTKAEEFKKVFTSKNQFKEFIKFIKNGFKIK